MTDVMTSSINIFSSKSNYGLSFNFIQSVEVKIPVSHLFQLSHPWEPRCRVKVDYTRCFARFGNICAILKT